MELEDTYKQWNQNPNNENLEQLFEATKPVLESAMTSYAGTTDDPVIRLEAYNLARKAFDNYDVEKGAKLKTYLMHRLKGLTRTLHNRAQELKIPQQSWFDIQNLNSAEEEFFDQRGREPSVGELADITGMSLKRIEYLKRFKTSAVPESVLRESNIEDYIEPGEEQPPDPWAEMVYYSLGGTDQLIFDYRLGAHGQPQLSTKEIAKKLGISAPAISQRVNKIVTLLKRGE